MKTLRYSLLLSISLLSFNCQAVAPLVAGRVATLMAVFSKSFRPYIIGMGTLAYFQAVGASQDTTISDDIHTLEDIIKLSDLAEKNQKLAVYAATLIARNEPAHTDSSEINHKKVWKLVEKELDHTVKGAEIVYHSIRNSGAFTTLKETVQSLHAKIVADINSKKDTTQETAVIAITEMPATQPAEQPFTGK